MNLEAIKRQLRTEAPGFQIERASAYAELREAFVRLAKTGLREIHPCSEPSGEAGVLETRLSGKQGHTLGLGKSETIIFSGNCPVLPKGKLTDEVLMLNSGIILARSEKTQDSQKKRTSWKPLDPKDAKSLANFLRSYP
jgi:hypothetical protein